MTPDQRRALLSLAIMFGAIAGLFWWGFHFHLFGHAIRLEGPSLGFFGWLALGAFGAGYARGGAMGGLKWTGVFLVVMGAALAFGVATGHYR